MKPEITLVYDADCPNLPAARGALRKALEHEGLEPQWVEYDRAAPGKPALLVRFGSPTIRFLSRASMWPARRDMPPRPVGSIGASADFPASRRPRVSPWQSRILKLPASGALGFAGTAAIARQGTVWCPSATTAAKSF